MLKWNTKSLLLKNEAVYGTDAVPTVVANAILARNVTIKPLRLITDERNFSLPHFGNQGRLVSGQFVEVDFEVEMAGSGTAGTAPAYGPALKACGLSETIVAVTSATYAPATPVVGSDVSCDIYVNIGGRQHKVVGALGNVRGTLEAGKIPLFAFHFVGLFVVPTDVALAGLTLAAFQKPLPVNNANTTPATLFTYAAKFRRMEFDLGNKIDYRNVVNSEAVRFLDRKSTARFVFEGETVAIKDWWTIIKNATDGAFTVTQGTVAGNKMTIAAGQVQLLEPDVGDEGGVEMMTVPADLKPTTAGNDELSIANT